MALPTAVIVALLILPTVSKVEIASLKIETVDESQSEAKGEPGRLFPEIKPSHDPGATDLTEPRYVEPDQNGLSAATDAAPTE